MTWLSNYSDKVVPDINKHWSLLFEVNTNSLPKDATDEEILAINEKACRDIGLLGPENQIISRFIRRLELSYPVPFKARDDLVGKLLPYLEEKY